MMTNATLGPHLRRARHRRGLLQRDVADDAGISHTYLSRVETGVEKYAPKEKVLRRLAEILGEDPEHLLHLARRVPRDVADIITSDPGMPGFLRCVRDRQLSAHRLSQLIAGQLASAETPDDLLD